MKLRCILLIFAIIGLTGCENQEEIKKNEYIAMKNNILDDKNYQEEELPVEITTTIERKNEEEIEYQVTINHPKENMHHIKAMVVHNYNNEDVFPSIGVFDETKDLLLNSEEDNELILKGTIKSVKNLSKLELELKIWIEYTNDLNETKDIYYKTT